MLSNTRRMGCTHALSLSLLGAVLVFAAGCVGVGSVRSQVVDAQTRQPLPGAVVLGVWTKKVGVRGLEGAELVGVTEVEVDADGRFELARPHGADGEERITAYKFGYVAWSNVFIFPTSTRRPNASVPLLILLEPFPPDGDHRKHLDFLAGATWSTRKGETPLFTTALERERSMPSSRGLVAILPAYQVRYEGPTPDASAARIELASGEVREVAVGNDIPGVGRVVKIAETHLTVEQRVSAAEQEHLRSQGKLVYGILEFQIPRAGMGSPPRRRAP